MRRRTQAGLTILALFMAGTGYANASQAAQPSGQAAKPCTLGGSAHSSDGEWAGCLQVKAEMTTAPVVGGAATPITFTIFAQQALDDVRIEADLPANLKWAAVPAGLSAQSVKTGNKFDRGTINRAGAAVSLAAGSTTAFKGGITATATGSAQIRIRATYDVPGGTDAAEDSVFLTIGDQSSSLTIDVNGVQATAKTADTPVRSQVPAAKQRAVDPPSSPATQRPSGRGTEATSCVTGGWYYYDPAGTLMPSINMTVEAWEGGTLIAGVLTDWGGRYSLCFANGPAGRTVTVLVITKNNRWRVQQLGTVNDYVFGIGTFYLADGANLEIGPRVSADRALDRGLSAFDSANAAWNWKPGSCWDMLDAPAACRQAVINWSPTSTISARYNFAEIFLEAADPDARSVVIHEIGHFVMHDVYDGLYPPIPNCSPHAIHLRSSPGCAWSEGFAEWFPAMVLNDPFFRWADGSFLNLETPTWTTGGWDLGDDVEGRVAGALIDISDWANEGYWDGYGEGPINIWNTFLNNFSNNFAEFWNQRAGGGYNVTDAGALGCVYQNTIDYSFRNPLGDYAELTRPRPFPSHNFGYHTWATYWSVVAVRPPAGADYDLQLFDDRAQTVSLNGSFFGGNTVEFIAVDSLRRPLGDYYPRVPLWSGTGDYQIELAQGTNILWTNETVTMTAADVVLVRDVWLTAGVPVTLAAVPENSGQDADLFVMQSDASAASWVKARSQATAFGISAAPGNTETITFTPGASAWYGLVVVNKSGSGKYTLSKS